MAFLRWLPHLFFWVAVAGASELRWTQPEPLAVNYNLKINGINFPVDYTEDAQGIRSASIVLELCAVNAAGEACSPVHLRRGFCRLDVNDNRIVDIPDIGPVLSELGQACANP